MAELDRKIAELGKDFGPVRLYLQGFCLILAQLAYTQYPLQETGTQISALDISYFPLNFSTRVS